MRSIGIQVSVDHPGQHARQPFPEVADEHFEIDVAEGPAVRTTSGLPDGKVLETTTTVTNVANIPTPSTEASLGPSTDFCAGDTINMMGKTTETAAGGAREGRAKSAEISAIGREHTVMSRTIRGPQGTGGANRATPHSPSARNRRQCIPQRIKSWPINSTKTASAAGRGGGPDTEQQHAVHDLPSSGRFSRSLPMPSGGDNHARSPTILSADETRRKPAWDGSVTLGRGNPSKMAQAKAYAQQVKVRRSLAAAAAAGGGASAGVGQSANKRENKSAGDANEGSQGKTESHPDKNEGKTSALPDPSDKQSLPLKTTARKINDKLIPRLI